MNMSNRICEPVFDHQYAQLHIQEMQHYDIPKIIQAIRERLPGKVTQQVLAERLSTRGSKISQEQIHRWEKKGQEPKTKNLARLLEVAQEVGALADGVSSEDIAAALPTATPERVVKIVGWVGAGASFRPYDGVGEQYLESVPAPARSDERTVAVEIKGDSLGQIFNGWIAFYSDRRSPVTQDLIGRLCVVGVADGRILLKRLQVGRQKGTFTLESNQDTAPPTENVHVEWAARVIHLEPKG